MPQCSYCQVETEELYYKYNDNAELSCKDCLNQKQKVDSKKHNDFINNLLKGRIGQVIVETVFEKFGYDVFPYGYESYLTSIIKDLNNGGNNETVKKIRTTPDTLVYHREKNKAFFVEVKTTNHKADHYWMSEKDLLNYKELWGSAILVILHSPSLTIYCKPLNEIDPAALKVEFRKRAYPVKGIVHNLEQDFFQLQDFFEMINKKDLQIMLSHLKDKILPEFNA